MFPASSRPMLTSWTCGPPFRPPVPLPRLCLPSVSPTHAFVLAFWSLPGPPGSLHLSSETVPILPFGSWTFSDYWTGLALRFPPLNWIGLTRPPLIDIDSLLRTLLDTPYCLEDFCDCQINCINPSIQSHCILGPPFPKPDNVFPPQYVALECWAKEPKFSSPLLPKLKKIIRQFGDFVTF